MCQASVTMATNRKTEANPSGRMLEKLISNSLMCSVLNNVLDGQRIAVESV